MGLMMRLLVLAALNFRIYLSESYTNSKNHMLKNVNLMQGLMQLNPRSSARILPPNANNIIASFTKQKPSFCVESG
jgi:hypothetical protein